MNSNSKSGCIIGLLVILYIVFNNYKDMLYGSNLKNMLYGSNLKDMLYSSNLKDMLYGSNSQNNCIKVGAVLFIISMLIYKFNNNVEMFGNYKSSCDKLPTAIQHALDTRDIKKVNDDSWDYYLPCGYNRCESDILAFKNNTTGKKIFMIDGCDWLASKIGLWHLIKKEFGRYSHYIMPETFILSENKDIENFKKFYMEKKQENKDCKFILKNFKQRQQGLKLANDLKTIFNSVGDGYKIVQDFLENPYVVSGRKVNFRYYLLITCYKGEIKGYLYRDGFVYYTPKVFKKNSMDFEETITTGYIDRQVYEENPLTIQDFRKHIGKENSSKFDNNVILTMKAVMKALSTQICSNKKLDQHMKFQIFGADIAPDENLNTTIMEINKGPDIGFKDKRDGDLKKNMVEDVFKIIEPLEGDTPHNFETLV